MRLVFAGTPAVAVPTLDALASGPHELAAVVTRPDAPLGRKRILTPSPVAERAAALGLPILRASRLGEDETRQIADLAPDLGVIVAYGGIVRPPLLAVPRLGWINLHFSLLPAWRGAAPVQRSVLAGETTTGISVFQLEEGLDTGPWFSRRAVDIGPEETAGELLDRLALDGASDVVDVVNALAEGTAVATPQHGSPSHAAKLSAADGVVDWAADAAAVHARIRGATPEPGATTTLRGDRVKLLEVRASEADGGGRPGQIRLVDGAVLIDAGAGAVELRTVQPAGKRGMPARDWLRGLADAQEARFE